MQLCLLIKGFHCARRGRSFRHCAGVANRFCVVVGWEMRDWAEVNRGHFSHNCIQPHVYPPLGPTAGNNATGNLIDTDLRNHIYSTYIPPPTSTFLSFQKG